ncbi:MAG: beta-galactosidase [Clostridia bacterium]|nr:beta-galactosidase [Clostridia bacterium]
MYRLIKAGSIAPKSPKDISFSRLGIGFEKLDRNVFDPEKAYDKLAAIGVKHVRLQSGWLRTEKEKGIYDFAWLDSIVDRIISDGMEPWLCLCYGNPLYSEMGKEVFGAVGVAPIFTDEEKSAWAAYVNATVSHFKGRIRDYEIWNEPDGKHCWKHGVSATEYGMFAASTAKVIKSADENARVLVGALCRANLPYVCEAAAAGMLDDADAITYHCYTPSDMMMRDNLVSLVSLAERLKPGLKVIQGESGTQSRGGGHGALRTGAWTEEKQVKYMARHLCIDLYYGAEFTSYFSTMDMIEALRGVVGDTSSYLDYGYFGVLGAQFDENGFCVGDYSPKPSYRTLQTLAAVFEGEWKPCVLPVRARPGQSPYVFGDDAKDFGLQTCGFERPDGSAAFVYWYASDLLKSSYSGTETFMVGGMTDDIRLIDLCDGTVYKIPETMFDKAPGGYHLVNLPLSDRPMMIEFGKFVR